MKSTLEEAGRSSYLKPYFRARTFAEKYTDRLSNRLKRMKTHQTAPNRLRAITQSDRQIAATKKQKKTEEATTT